jgi:acetyltransferase-like isoleucine patch superfamily enzyme
MKELNNSLSSSDLIFMVWRKSGNLIRWFYWKALLGKLGKGSYLRNKVRIVGNPKRVKVGNHFQVWHRCLINVGTGSVIFGNNGHLGVDAYINAARGCVSIGDNVAIAPKTQIYSYTDSYEIGKRIGESHAVADVVVGNNVLIGSGAIILPGVTISEGAIVAAGAVVNKNVDAYTIVGGMPAVKLKDRPR